MWVCLHLSCCKAKGNLSSVISVSEYIVGGINNMFWKFLIISNRFGWILKIFKLLKLHINFLWLSSYYLQKLFTKNLVWHSVSALSNTAVSCPNQCRIYTFAEVGSWVKPNLTKTIMIVIKLTYCRLFTMFLHCLLSHLKASFHLFTAQHSKEWN